jgi:hypothetical protein
MNEYRPVEQKSNATGFIVGVVLLVILIVIISTFFYLQKHNKLPSLIQKLGNKEQTEVVHGFYTISLTSNGNNFHYELRVKQNNTLVATSKYDFTIREKYLNAEYNVTYKFSGKSSDFYYNSVDCLVLSNITCDLPLKQIGNYTLFLINDLLRIKQYSTEGVLQEPLICIAWDSNMYTIRISQLEQTNIPIRLKAYVDICYGAGGDMESDKEYLITYRKINDLPSNTRFYLVDKDVDEYNIATYEVDTGFPDYVYERVI